MLFSCEICYQDEEELTEGIDIRVFTKNEMSFFYGRGEGRVGDRCVKWAWLCFKHLVNYKLVTEN